MSKASICVYLMFYGLAITEHFFGFPVILQCFFGFFSKHFWFLGFPQPSKRDSTKVRGRNMTENPSQK
ncbi:hypothetical protein OBV_37450 [Oscillibacter valericigenes Sjm18-20]|nr:hypothetical protein OBV_37450 [Oscillibacter valericigenes Sjm18-20]